MRGEKVKKVYFFQAQGIKTVHAGTGQKMAKFCPDRNFVTKYLLKVVQSYSIIS